MSGTLYGVGVGPGDPELMTLKAARILKSAKVVAYFAKQGSKGHARGIAASALAEGCEEWPLYYPITTEIPASDPAYAQAMGAFYDDAAQRIAARLASDDVAVLCEGDPFLYGSFMHLFRRLHERFPCRVIPGITAMAGSAAAAGLPMTWGNDTLTVLPGTLPQDVLLQRLQACDAAVIMKVGRHLPKVRAALAAVNMLARATYVEYGTMDNQKIIPLAEHIADAAPYFSLILVPGCGRQP